MSREDPSQEPRGSHAGETLSLTREQAEQRLAQLTAREREVLALLATGATTRVISERLGISPGTVKQHLRGVYRQLATTNRVQATRIYLLIHPDQR